MGCHAQYINQGEVARRYLLLLRDGLGVSQQVLSSCIGHLLFLLGFSPLSLLHLIIIILLSFNY